jgi:hypothetical protein
MSRNLYGDWPLLAILSVAIAAGCQPSSQVSDGENSGISDQPSSANAVLPEVRSEVDTEPTSSTVQADPPKDLESDNQPLETGSQENIVSNKQPAGTSEDVASSDEATENIDRLKTVEPPPSTRATPSLAGGGPGTISAGVAATEDELNQTIGQDWPTPQLVLYVSGQQQGYIEPCGCTGLDSQKGGLIRRDTLLSQLRDRGWEVVPVDVGNQVRRVGPQPLAKFDTTARAMEQMGYKAVALGVDDLKLSKVDLIQTAGSEGSSPRPFICANVEIFLPEFFPPYRIVEVGARKIGITAILGSQYQQELQSDEIEFMDPVERLQAVVPEMRAAGCDFIVLLAHASLKESASIAQSVDSIDLVVTAGGYGEPTLHPESIEGSKAVMVQVGTKGMYGGIVGLFDDPDNPIRYQKLAISSQFEDSKRMLTLFAEYQDRLKEMGLSGLGLTPAIHPTGRQFVGSEACGDCHTTAYDIWLNSPHVHATESIVAANNDRGGIPRHFDPECISCHVTGWHPQQFFPYESGYLDLAESEHLVGSGCENCHGPGSAHVAAELGDIEATPDLLKELREEMILPLARAEAKCMECHDLDNSPDFHEPGAFDIYWEQVKHYGKD